MENRVKKTKKIEKKGDLVVKLYDITGKKQGSVSLDEKIFGNKVNNNAIYEVYNSYRSNGRRVCASTKNRALVAGGSSKPWRQKGTGRARHGTIRSPIWKGGGVVFGPSAERNYSRTVTKKKKNAVLKMVLSGKVKDKEVAIIEEYSDRIDKTKKANKLLVNIGEFKEKTSKTLIALDKNKDVASRAFRNVTNVVIKNIGDVNPADLLETKYFLLSKEGLKNLEERLK